MIRQTQITCHPMTGIYSLNLNHEQLFKRQIINNNISDVILRISALNEVSLCQWCFEMNCLTCQLATVDEICV